VLIQLCVTWTFHCILSRVVLSNTCCCRPVRVVRTCNGIAAFKTHIFINTKMYATSCFRRIDCRWRRCTKIWLNAEGNCALDDIWRKTYVRFAALHLPEKNNIHLGAYVAGSTIKYSYVKCHCNYLFCLVLRLKPRCICRVFGWHRNYMHTYFICWENGFFKIWNSVNDFQRCHNVHWIQFC